MLSILRVIPSPHIKFCINILKLKIYKFINTNTDDFIGAKRNKQKEEAL